MMKKLHKLPLLMAVVLLIAMLPIGGLASDFYDIMSKTDLNADLPTPAAALSNGQVWVQRTANSAGLSPDATVTLSALGELFQSATASATPCNIMFLLDISGSMGYNDSSGKDANMASAANSAAEALAVNGNKLGVVLFGNDADVKRELKTDLFTLTAGSATSSGDTIGCKSQSQGTNIQAALNAAYDRLSKQTNGATPVIILMTDGAPTYYYDNITGMYFGNTANRTGSGQSTTVDYVSHTIAQAAYLKARMPSLRIYTIAFDTGNDISAAATLNPSAATFTAYDNANSGSKLTTALNSIKNSTTITDQYVKSMNFYYADKADSATTASGSLKNAFGRVARAISSSIPVTEVTQTGGGITENSYIRVYDTIGASFLLPAAMTLSLDGSSYTFNYHSDNKDTGGNPLPINNTNTNDSGVFTYDVTSTTPGYNARLANMKVLYQKSGDTRKVIWMLPASLLPCRNVDGGGDATPIRLSYVITLDVQNLNITGSGDVNFNTSSNCSVSFLPAADNPYYTSNTPTETHSYNSSDRVTNTTYYAITTQTAPKKNATATILSYGSGLSATALTYQDPTDTGSSALYANVNQPSTLNLTLSGSSTAIPLSVSTQSASAVFRTSNRDAAGSYIISSLNVGGIPYADGRVTAVSGSGNSRDITISYNGGLSTLLFSGVAMSQITSSVNATFKSKAASISGIIADNTNVTLSPSATGIITKVDYYTTGLFTKTYHYTFNVAASDGTYTFEDVTFSTTTGEYKYTSGSVSSDGFTPNDGAKYASNSVSTTYYSATGQLSTSKPAYSYTADSNKIVLDIATQGVLTFRDSLVTNSATNTTTNTIITSANGGYVIKVIVSNTLTGNSTTTIYTLNQTTLKVETYSSQPSGIVNQSMTSSGYFTLTASNLLYNAKLFALNGSGTAMANTAGQAYLKLTFSSKAAFKDMSILLSTAAASNTGFTSYTITGVDGGLTWVNGSNTVSAAGIGNYTVYLTVTNPFGSSKSSFILYMYELDFFTTSGTGKKLVHEEDYSNQKVKVIFSSPMGH